MKIDSVKGVIYTVTCKGHSFTYRVDSINNHFYEVLVAIDGKPLYI